MSNARKKIAVVAPASRVAPETPEKVTALAATLFSDAAPEIHFHPQCFLSSGHFAGTDAERGAAFLEAANDPSFDAVWFGRGGYGSGRIDEGLYARLNAAAREKTYLGYSDLGFVLARLYAEKIGKPVHGPMPSDINRPGGEAAVSRALAFLAKNEASGLEPAARTSGRKFAAFNLTILVHVLAAPWAPDLSDHVIMVEEISEHHYRIDRAFGAIMANPRVKAAAGIMLGRCGDIPPNDPAFEKTEEDIARYWCAPAGVPYLGRADIGHDADNKIVPFGASLLV
jgi:muramoyltetrapeptide carboxypeptidase